MKATAAQMKLAVLILEQVSYQYGWLNQGSSLLDNTFNCFVYSSPNYVALTKRQENMIWEWKLTIFTLG